MSLECIWCKDWMHQSYILNGFIQIASARSGKDLFAEAGGKAFKFCPWCGHELHEVTPRDCGSTEQRKGDGS